jgi:hypothetical protein
MTDAGPAGGEGRRRGKKNRGRQRRKRPKGGRGGGGGGGGGNRNYQQTQQDKMPTTGLDDKSVLGGREPKTQERRGTPSDGPPDAFALFCSYYLGITPSDGYHKPNLEEVARRYSLSPKEVRDLLQEHQLDEESIRGSSFDLQGAQLDIRVCPEGISRVETARELFEEYLELKGG